MNILYKQFYEVDEDGFIVETHLLDTSKDDFKCPDNYFEGWGNNRTFFKPIYNFEINDWAEGQLMEELVSDAKNNKLAELNQKCEGSILGKFTVEINDAAYQFSNDMEAQMNFEKVDRAFEKGKMEEIPWTVYDQNERVLRIILNADSFSKVYLAHLNHIQDNISKFRDILQPQVENATTIEEIQSINW